MAKYSSERHKQGSCLGGQGKLSNWARHLQSAEMGHGSEDMQAVELTCIACTSLLTMGGMTSMPRFHRTASAMRDTCTLPAPHAFTVRVTMGKGREGTGRLPGRMQKGKADLWGRPPWPPRHLLPVWTGPAALLLHAPPAPQL